MDYQATTGQTTHCPVHELAVFSGLEEGFRTALQSVESEAVSYAGGESIYASGAAAHHFYIVREGYVKLFKTTLNGKDQIIRIVKPGEIFGFDGFVDICYNHHAVPLRQATVCRIPVERLCLLGDQRPEIERLIMVLCIRELQHADERLLELGAKRSAERLASFLLSWCAATPPGQWTPLVLSRLEIAQLLGLTIETVSRLFAQWKRDGVVEERQQAIQIAEPGKLQQVADSRE